MNRVITEILKVLPRSPYIGANIIEHCTWREADGSTSCAIEFRSAMKVGYIIEIKGGKIIRGERIDKSMAYVFPAKAAKTNTIYRFNDGKISLYEGTRYGKSHY